MCQVPREAVQMVNMFSILLDLTEFIVFSWVPIVMDKVWGAQSMGTTSLGSKVRSPGQSEGSTDT